MHAKNLNRLLADKLTNECTIETTYHWGDWKPKDNKGKKEWPDGIVEPYQQECNMCDTKCCYTVKMLGHACIPPHGGWAWRKPGTTEQTGLEWTIAVRSATDADATPWPLYRWRSGMFLECHPPDRCRARRNECQILCTAKLKLFWFTLQSSQGTFVTPVQSSLNGNVRML